MGIYIHIRVESRFPRWQVGLIGEGLQAMRRSIHVNCDILEGFTDNNNDWW